MSYHGLAGAFPSSAAIGNEVAKIVVPPVVKAVKAEVPGFLASVQPVLVSQGNAMIASLQPQLEKQGKTLLSSLQPQLEKQAVQAANALQPMIDKQLGNAEKRLSALIDLKVQDIASGAEMAKLKKQAVVALVVHGALIVLGVAAVTRLTRR
jgi:hypothetical protein